MQSLRRRRQGQLKRLGQRRHGEPCRSRNLNQRELERERERKREREHELVVSMSVSVSFKRHKTLPA